MRSLPLPLRGSRVSSAAFPRIAQRPERRCFTRGAPLGALECSHGCGDARLCGRSKPVERNHKLISAPEGQRTRSAPQHNAITPSAPTFLPFGTPSQTSVLPLFSKEVLMGVRSQQREELERLKAQTLEAQLITELRHGPGCSPFEIARPTPSPRASPAPASGMRSIRKGI